ncbi:MAG TPA: YfhO family protein [Thermoanaerobaculia bacterium]|nr:YfhO family protein [Thermoanaerobaculia bacterium]
MDVLLFLLGSALITALVRWWRPEVSLRAAAGYVLASGLFFAVPLFTPAVQVHTDIAYAWAPWRETLPAPPAPGNDLMMDIPTQMIPFRELVRRRLLDLELPLWAHEMATGQALLGNAQSAPFAPLHLMALPLPTVRALTVAAAWQILLALLLTHALARTLGAGELGAAFAAVAFSFSTFVICWAYHPIGMTVTWVPGVLLGLFLLRRGARRGFAGLVACATGMTLSGHPESVAHMAVVSAAVVAVLLVSRDEFPRTRFLALLAAAGALTFCLTAPYLLPILEVMPESERWALIGRAPDLIQTPPFRTDYLVTLVNPLAYGSPRDANWIGFFNFNETCTNHAGLLTLALALAGAFLRRGRTAWLLAGAVAALFVAFRLPPFFEVMAAVPGLGHAMHGRLRLFWILGAALAAGLSLEDLSRRDWRATAAFVLAVGLALLVLLPPIQVWQMAWWGAALLGIAAALAALAIPRLRPFFPAVALAVLVLDLALIGVRFHTVLPKAFDLTPPPALAFLMEQERQSPEPFRVAAENADLLPSLASYYGLWDLRGNDPMQPALPAYIVGSSFMPDFRVARLVQLRFRRFPQNLQPQFDEFGVRYLLTRHGRRLPSPWRPAFDGVGGTVWENPRVLPLFYVPAAVERVPQPWTLVERALEIEDFKTLTVVEVGPAGPPVAQEGRVRVARVRANGFDLEVESPAGGLVASSVSHVRGWRLRREGEEAPVLRVNGGFVGFGVPPGRHRVELDYRPSGWTWGVQAFSLGLVGLLLAAWRAMRRKPATPP